MVTEKLNDELTSIPAHLVTFSQPKSADNLLRISVLYATPNDACLLLNQQHLFYKICITKQVQEVWVFLCCYHKNYSVYKHENTIIISLVTVNLFRRKIEDNYMLGFGTCSDPNWNTIVHWSVRDSLRSWPEGGAGLCGAWLQVITWLQDKPSGWFHQRSPKASPTWQLVMTSLAWPCLCIKASSMFSCKHPFNLTVEMMNGVVYF